MPDGKGLALIFGDPKGKGKPVSADADTERPEYPPDFEDHCQAAFDAIRDKDSRAFCGEMWLAIKAYEEREHEEGEESGETVEEEE